MGERRVAYVVSEDLVKLSNLLPSNRGRSSVVHSLASSLGFFQRDGPFSNLKVFRPKPASSQDLTSYHDSAYVEFILNSSETSAEDPQNESFGIEDDCPYFDGLPQYVRLLAGATLEAAEILKSDKADISIVWDGGRHHAEKAHASGFCYINDIILGIISLRKAKTLRPRIMYIDLDLHFSDGVSQAFVSSAKFPSVLNLSIHHTGPGFFPATDQARLTPLDTANPFAISLPLGEGTSNATFARVWKSCVEPIKDVFVPTFVVVQCGVDGLAGDPYKVWNWGLDVNHEGSLGWCISQCLSWGPKVMLLGGGGYNSPNAARAWAYLTSLACGSPWSMDSPIPDHLGFPLYAPSFSLEVAAGNMEDQNKPSELDDMEERCRGLIDRLRPLCPVNL